MIADGPATRGIEIGNTAKLFISLSSINSTANVCFLLILFSKTISYEIINKNSPPTILNELTDIPINIRKTFPYKEKNVRTLDVIKKTKKASLIVFFVFKL